MSQKGEDGGGKPETEVCEGAEDDGEDHDVEAAESVGEVAWYPAAEEGARHEDGHELVCECRADAGVWDGEGVGYQVRDWGEETPFYEENAGGC